MTGFKRNPPSLTMATFISDSNNLRTDSKYRIQHYEQKTISNQTSLPPWLLV
jgi:hypothetical protein